MPLLATPIDELLRQLLSHPIILFALIAALGSALKALASKRTPPATRPPAERRNDESDLEARVRRNFEEMMRRRAATPPAAPPPAPVAPPRPAPRPIVDYDTRARPEPTSTEGPRAVPVVVRRTTAERVRADKAGATASRHLEAAAKAVAGNVRSAASTRVAKRARVLELRRGAVELQTLRQAVLLREVLDPPIALRG